MLPLQRIIVYVDDLDRCSPDRVVEVLAAVHLMLAVEKFLVVVAVDPRWLLRCLQYHYAKLLDADDTSGPMATTPIDYLEKIFQIAYRVPKLDDGFDQYVRGLLPIAPPPRQTSGQPDDERASPTAVADLVVDTSPTDEPATRLRPEGIVEASDPLLATLSPKDARAIADRTNEILGELVPAAAGPDVDLVLDALTVTAEEQNVAAVLLPLLETPRAVKRLANSYRIYRASIPADDLPDYLAERRFEPAMVLLGAAVGQPLAAPSIFQRIAAADDGARIGDVFAGPSAGGGDPATNTSPGTGDAPTTADRTVDQTLPPATTSSAVGPTKDAGPVPDRSSEHEAIGRFRHVLSAEALTVTEVESYRRCIDHVARFSFRYMELTGRVAGGTGRPGVASAPASGPPPPAPEDGRSDGARSSAGTPA